MAQVSGSEFFRTIVEEILDCVVREVTEPMGGFYSTQDAISARADGYAPKQIGSDELLTARQRLGWGESLLDPTITGWVLARMREMRQLEQTSAFASLSSRQMQILARVGQGKTNREIVASLRLSERTVRNCVSSILSKLNLTSRAQAAACAARHGIEDRM